MSELIITGNQSKKTKIKAGRLYLVKNVDKPHFSNAKSQYFALWVEDSNGKNERPLLITERELNIVETRSSNNPEDKFSLEDGIGTAVLLDDVKIVEGRFILVYNTNKKYCFENDYYYGVVIKDAIGSSIGCYLFTLCEIIKMENRAEKNPNTIPKKGWITDMFD